MGKLLGGLKRRSISMPSPMKPQMSLSGEAGTVSEQLGGIVTKLGGQNEFLSKLEPLVEEAKELGLNKGGYYQDGGAAKEDFFMKMNKYRKAIREGRSGIIEEYPDIGVDTQDAKLAAGEGVVNREGMSLLGVDNLNALNQAGLALREQGIDPNPIPVGVAPGSDGTDGLNSFGPGPRVPQPAGALQISWASINKDNKRLTPTTDH